MCNKPLLFAVKRTDVFMMPQQKLNIAKSVVETTRRAVEVVSLPNNGTVSPEQQI